MFVLNMCMCVFVFVFVIAGAVNFNSIHWSLDTIRSFSTFELC